MGMLEIARGTGERAFQYLAYTENKYSTLGLTSLLLGPIHSLLFFSLIFPLLPPPLMPYFSFFFF
ncbi:uncharacterized protein BDW47DRAFT_114219, partial [Aspergillus candidus]